MAVLSGKAGMVQFALVWELFGNTLYSKGPSLQLFTYKLS